MTGESAILELDGPPQAYFEIPLDYFATPNGEIEAAGHPEASRLVQRIHYVSFELPTANQVRVIRQQVEHRLKELGGGVIWWRRRPCQLKTGNYWLRLGTTPQLPRSWWLALGSEAGNLHVDHGLQMLTP